jgi:hypothetical protein
MREMPKVLQKPIYKGISGEGLQDAISSGYLESQYERWPGEKPSHYFTTDIKAGKEYVLTTASGNKPGELLRIKSTKAKFEPDPEGEKGSIRTYDKIPISDVEIFKNGKWNPIVKSKEEPIPLEPTLPPGVGAMPQGPVKEVAATTPPGVPTIRTEKTEVTPVQVVPTIIPIGQQVQIVEPPPTVEVPVAEPVFPITNEGFKEFDKPFNEFDLNTIPEEMTIKVQAIREETGKPVEIYENARETIKDHREKMKQFKSLLDCIRA